MIDLPKLQKDKGTPLAEQIAEHFRRSIGDGHLRAGAKLPTIREVAEQSGVTRATVQLAYRRLAESGLVMATVGRGTVVADSAGVKRGPISRVAEGAWQDLQSRRTVPMLPEGREVVANFAGLLPDESQFPVDAFRIAMERVLKSRGNEALCYGDPAGSPELRRLLLGRYKDGVSDSVLITSGAQQGIDLVLRAFAEPGDAVAMAVPTYHHLFGVLKAQGLHVVPIDGDVDGFDLKQLREALQKPQVRALYVMPTFQNPTGRTMSVEQRKAMMDIVTETDVPVLEDEFECELRFRGEALPTLRSMDPRGLTVTVRTFSKGLFPGVRIGWVHGADKLLGPMSALKRFSDLETSPLLQEGMVEFLRLGVMDDYLATLRTELKKRFEVARGALTRHMPVGTTWSDPDGGYALWVSLPGNLAADRVTELAASRGVLAVPGRVFDPLNRVSGGMRLSLSRTSPEQVRAGIQILADCASELAQSGHSTQPPLFL